MTYICLYWKLIKNKKINYNRFFLLLLYVKITPNSLPYYETRSHYLNSYRIHNNLPWSLKLTIFILTIYNAQLKSWRSSSFRRRIQNLREQLRSDRTTSVYPWPTRRVHLVAVCVTIFHGYNQRWQSVRPGDIQTDQVSDS